MTTEDRPVYRDPDYRSRDPQLTYAEQEPASAGWDLAFGCRLSVGPFENGAPLRVTVNLSDQERAAGICTRTVTPEQVNAFARYLLRVAAAETGPVRCRTNDAFPHDPAVALVGGEPRCAHCVEVIGDGGPVEAEPLPATQPEPKLSAVTL